MPTVPIDKVISKIQQLPPLPLVVSHLLEVVDNDESSAKDLARILKCDQALTSKVLQLVNSSFYGLSRKISSVNHAVVILGYRAIRHLSLGLATYDAFKKQVGSLDQEASWQHTLCCAASSHVIAARLRHPVPEEAFVAGLLHDIGRMILNVSSPEDFAKLRPAHAAELLEQEEEIFGIPHTKAGSLLLERWKLPEQCCRVARFHHSPSMASATKELLLTSVMLADALSATEDSCPFEKVDGDVVCQLMTAAGIPAEGYRPILLEMGSRIAQTREFLNETGKPAGHTVDESPGEAVEDISTIAVMGTDPQRTQWIQSLLEHFGHLVLRTEPGGPDVMADQSLRYLILDPQDLTQEQVRQISGPLAGRNVRVALVEAAGRSADEVSADCATLPFVFSREDVEALIRGAR